MRSELGTYGLTYLRKRARDNALSSSVVSCLFVHNQLYCVKEKAGTMLPTQSTGLRQECCVSAHSSPPKLLSSSRGASRWYRKLRRKFSANAHSRSAPSDARHYQKLAQNL